MNELILKDNEIVINENTKLINIKNKDKYTKLIINKKIKPLFLNSFKNVNELEIDGIWYIEERINKLSFKDNIEKLVIKNIKALGSKTDKSGWGTDYYRLPTPNLKILELPSTLKYINNNYINNLEKVETIIFNVSNTTNFTKTENYNKASIVLPDSINKFIIKTEFNNYNIDFEYKPKYLSQILFSSVGIIIKYNNDNISSKVIIDNDKVYKINTLTEITDELIRDKCLYIPDNINDLKIEKKSTIKEINSISINPKNLRLNEMNDYRNISQYIKNINKIIIRDCNEMKLNPNNELTTEEYGNLKEIYIANKKIIIEFSDYIFKIDIKGNIEKTKIIKEEKHEEIYKGVLVKTKENDELIEDDENENILDERYTNLNTYTSRELEYYTYYKKILELISPDTEEVRSAMNVVENELVKKLKL